MKRFLIALSVVAAVLFAGEAQAQHAFGGHHGGGAGHGTGHHNHAFGFGFRAPLILAAPIYQQQAFAAPIYQQQSPACSCAPVSAGLSYDYGSGGGCGQSAAFAQSYAPSYGTYAQQIAFVDYRGRDRFINGRQFIVLGVPHHGHGNGFASGHHRH